MIPVIHRFSRDGAAVVLTHHTLGVTANLGVFRTAELLARGMTRSEIERRRVLGDLVRVRRGWWATSQADPLVLRAVGAKGVLTCASALRLHGVWVLDCSQLHLRHSKHFQRMGVPSGLSVKEIKLCGVPGPPRGPERGIDDIQVALSAAARCLPAAELVVIMDSLLNLELSTSAELEEALARAPMKVRSILTKCDRAESGTETLVRLKLRARGIAVHPQKVISGVGRVDLLIGRRLIIEVDSRQHHTSAEAYESDRARDRKLTAMGYLVVRLSYRQVLHEWAEIEPDLLALIRRDAHLGGLPSTVRTPKPVQSADHKVAARPI